MSGSQFVGTWVTRNPDPFKANLKEFLEKVGLSEQYDLWKDAIQTETYEINKDGSEWTSIVSVDKYPGMEKKYIYKPGVEFEGEGFDGTPGKATVFPKSDTVVHEVNKWTSPEGKNFEATVIKTIKGDIMEVTIELDGIVCKSSLQKK